MRVSTNRIGERRSGWTGVLCALLVGFPMVASGAEPTSVPGTSVAIVVPSGYEVSKSVTGFESSDRRSSIQVFELPISYASLNAAQSDSSFGVRGEEVLSSDEVTVAGIRGRMIQTRNRSGEVLVDAWVLLLGSSERSIKIIASYPSALASTHEKSLRQALLSLRWDPNEAIDIHAGRHYTVRETEHLKIVSHANNTYLFTEGGTTGVLQPEDPILIVAESRGQPKIEDLEVFAIERLKQTKALRDIENITGGLVTIGGFPAYELMADARDQRSEIPAKVYQVLIYDGEKFYMIQGLVSELRSDGFLPEFREIAYSFEKVAATSP